MSSSIKPCVVCGISFRRKNRHRVICSPECRAVRFSPLPHGLSRYTTKKCRCQICTESMRAYCREHRAKLKAERVAADGEMVR
jgi:hypothetical protein